MIIVTYNEVSEETSFTLPDYIGEEAFEIFQEQMPELKRSAGGNRWEIYYAKVTVVLREYEETMLEALKLANQVLIAALTYERPRNEH